MILEAALAGIGWGLISYYADIDLRRDEAEADARAVARIRGRPLLNVGAGSQRTALFGAHLAGDLNVDLGGLRGVPHGTPGIVTYADAQALPFPNGSIGAVLASHVVEHLPDPARALGEFARVTGDPRAVFVLTPSWWAPHTWLHPEHRWYFPDGAGGTKDGRLYPI